MYSPVAEDTEICDFKKRQSFLFFNRSAKGTQIFTDKITHHKGHTAESLLSLFSCGPSSHVLHLKQMPLISLMEIKPPKLGPTMNFINNLSSDQSRNNILLALQVSKDYRLDSGYSGEVVAERGHEGGFLGAGNVS